MVSRCCWVGVPPQLMSGVISSTSSTVSISSLSFRVFSLPLSTNSCGWVRSPSCIWKIVPGRVSFGESCDKSHWLCVPTTPSEGGDSFPGVLCQVHQTCVLCHVLPILVVVFLCHVSPHAPTILPYLTCRWGLTTSDRDIRLSDGLSHYSYSK